jgi:ferredoxin
MCKLVSGNVSYKIEWPGLSREEKAENFILPCVATPDSALVIDVPRATKAA